MFVRSLSDAQCSMSSLCIGAFANICPAAAWCDQVTAHQVDRHMYVWLLNGSGSCLSPSLGGFLKQTQNFLDCYQSVIAHTFVLSNSLSNVNTIFKTGLFSVYRNKHIVKLISYRFMSYDYYLHPWASSPALSKSHISPQAGIVGEGVSSFLCT